MKVSVIAACALALCASRSALAQSWPSEPLAFGGGRVTIGGDISASIAPEDPGFFNYTDYEHSALRMVRVDLSSSVKAGDHFSFLAEVRSENADTPLLYALYVRFRPWANRRVDIQIGRIPPTFGAFARRTYPSDNPLIGYPLAYQYLTTIRPDSLPANADELLRVRGLGWLDRFSIGNTALDKGVPLISAFRWDTGVQVHAGNDFVDASASVTAGTVSNPLFHDDNGGKQVAGRLELRPVAGLIIGGSGARGPFVGDDAARAANAEHGPPLTQSAIGADVEYSRDYYLLRFETIISGWRLPIVREPVLELPLNAYSTSLEGRYKLMPGVYLAARFDHLTFSDLAGTTVTEPWDAPVTRLEVGAGFSLHRNLLLKASFQHNARDGGRLEQHANMPAAQIVFWF